MPGGDIAYTPSVGLIGDLCLHYLPTIGASGVPDLEKREKNFKMTHGQIINLKLDFLGIGAKHKK